MSNGNCNKPWPVSCGSRGRSLGGQNQGRHGARVKKSIKMIQRAHRSHIMEAETLNVCKKITLEMCFSVTCVFLVYLYCKICK